MSPLKNRTTTIANCAIRKLRIPVNSRFSAWESTKLKDIKYTELYAVYGKLLTEVQAEITEMYYMFDLSLSEIAEIKNVTRQSVADALKKVRSELDDLEDKLKFVAKKRAILDFADTLDDGQKASLMNILED